MRLTEDEVSRLAAFKQMAEADFIQSLTRLSTDRRGLALVERPDGACIFLEGDQCAVQSVKPSQCREFPNLWSFPGFEIVCGSIPREVTEDEYNRLIEDALGKVSDAQGTPPTTGVTRP